MGDRDLQTKNHIYIKHISGGESHNFKVNDIFQGIVL